MSIDKFKKFDREDNYKKGIMLEEMAWKLPVKTDHMEQSDLIRSVRFESDEYIRFLTSDNRDIIFKLDPDETTVHYASEVQVDNTFSVSD